jgi:hypothetical protein
VRLILLELTRDAESVSLLDVESEENGEEEREIHKISNGSTVTYDWSEVRQLV